MTPTSISKMEETIGAETIKAIPVSAAGRQKTMSTKTYHSECQSSKR